MIEVSSGRIRLGTHTLHGGGGGGAFGTHPGPCLGGISIQGRGTARSIPEGCLHECAQPREAEGDEASQIKTIEVTSLVPL